MTVKRRKLQSGTRTLTEYLGNDNRRVVVDEGNEAFFRHASAEAFLNIVIPAWGVAEAAVRNRAITRDVIGHALGEIGRAQAVVTAERAAVARERAEYLAPPREQDSIEAVRDGEFRRYFLSLSTEERAKEMETMDLGAITALARSPTPRALGAVHGWSTARVAEERAKADPEKMAAFRERETACDWAASATSTVASTIASIPLPVEKRLVA